MTPVGLLKSAFVPTPSRKPELLPPAPPPATGSVVPRGSEPVPAAVGDLSSSESEARRMRWLPLSLKPTAAQLAFHSYWPQLAPAAVLT
jgi:hypothetical protein